MGSGTDAHDDGESSSSESNPPEPSGDSRESRVSRAGAARDGSPPGACAGVTNATAGVGGSPTDLASCGASALPEVAAAGVFCDEDATAAFPRFSDIDGPKGFGAE